ncbi:MAG: hypothetical protein H0X37_18915 [Herpetosiphonaceae bacterium]|nr:hypothetical protein [Herpetosiphonaceae bacterium]
MRRLVTFLVVLSSTLGVGLHGAQPVQAAPDLYFTRFYPQTNHNLFLPFLKFWDDMGGLPVFGFPKSEALLERNQDLNKYFLTQYFERERLELHPENTGQYRVLLGRLGVEGLQRQGRDWQSLVKGDPSTPHYYAQTGHAVASPFWDYFSKHGLDLGDPVVSERESLGLFGYPVSEPAIEKNSSGDTVLTQWFERARFEYHPSNPTPYKVLLGLLGNEVSGNQSAEVDFQPQAALDILRAAAHRWALAEAENVQRLIPYREDIQATADRYALKIDLAGMQTALSDHPPVAEAVAGANGRWLTACNKELDPNDPIGSNPHTIAEQFTPSMSAITVGVSAIYTFSCGPAVSFIIAATN